MVYKFVKGRRRPQLLDYLRELSEGLTGVSSTDAERGTNFLFAVPDGNFDGNGPFKDRRLLSRSVSSPDLPLAREDMPELAQAAVRADGGAGLHGPPACSPA